MVVFRDLSEGRYDRGLIVDREKTFLLHSSFSSTMDNYFSDWKLQLAIIIWTRNQFSKCDDIR